MLIIVNVAYYVAHIEFMKINGYTLRVILLLTK